MCIDFNGYHSGGSSFTYVNDFWLLQKLFVYPQIYGFAPRNQFGFANRVGPGIGA